MIRQLLGTTHHSEVESRVASGLPIYEMMEQIRLELRRSVGEEHALLFAEPNANADTGQIQWYASKEGAARPLVELAGDERQAAEVRLAQLTTEIQAHAAKLNQSRNPQDQHVAKVLEDALQIPRETDIFVVGGQPVIAAWGHVLRGPGAPSQILSALAERVKPFMPAPRSPVAESTTDDGSTSGRADGDATETQQPVAPLPTKNGEEDKKKRRRFGWLFWLGLLLLLILLLGLVLALFTRWDCYFEPCPCADYDHKGCLPPKQPDKVPGQPKPPPSRPPDVLGCSITTSSGGGKLTNKRHDLGDKPGAVTIEYDMHVAPDEMKVLYRGRLVASTRGRVSGKGTLSFNYQPEDGVYTVEVVIASASDGTTWNYTLGCPR